MSCLFDTNHCLDLMNGWNTPEEEHTSEERNTVHTVQQLSEDVVSMSEASVGERVYGIERSPRKASNRMRCHVLISAVSPVPIVRGVWKIYDETKAPLSLDGKRIPDMDLLVASTGVTSIFCLHNIRLLENSLGTPAIPGILSSSKFYKCATFACYDMGA